MSETVSRSKRAGEERALAMILPVIERLRLAAEAENRDLAERRAVDYQTYSQRKSQGLLELNRLRSALVSVSANPKARVALADLSNALETNRRLLHLQLRAAQTVSSILARAIREGQSDGTYPPSAWLVNEE